MVIFNLCFFPQPGILSGMTTADELILVQSKLQKFGQDYTTEELKTIESLNSKCSVDIQKHDSGPEFGPTNGNAAIVFELNDSLESLFLFL